MSSAAFSIGGSLGPRQNKTPPFHMAILFNFAWANFRTLICDVAKMRHIANAKFWRREDICNIANLCATLDTVLTAGDRKQELG